MAVRLTARARLAAVYVALVAAAGVVLIALTYLLVRRRIPVRVSFIDGEREQDRGSAPPDLSARAEQLRDETMHELLVQSLIALGVVVVLAGVAGWLVAGRLLRPIRAISRTAERVSAANLSERVVAPGPADELTALAGTINGMLDRVRHGVAERDRLLDGQRLFVANAAHELRTPLTTMRTAIDVTLDGEPTHAELRAMVTDISTAVDASRRTLDGLLALARSQAGSIRHEQVDLARTAADAIGQARDEADRRGVRFTSSLPPAPVHGEDILLLRMIGNLVDNAVRYNQPDGHVHVETHTGQRYAGVRVANTGPPVHPDDLARLFQPFARGSGARLRSGGGAGLGLSIVHAIATAHRGTVRCSAPDAGGLDITVELPRPS